MNSLASNYKNSLQEPGMAVGQRVKVLKKFALSRRTKYDGMGTVVAWLVSQTETAGVIDRVVSCVIECDDGRFLDCSLDEIQRVKEPATPEQICGYCGDPRSQHYKNQGHKSLHTFQVQEAASA